MSNNQNDHEKAAGSDGTETQHPTITSPTSSSEPEPPAVEDKRGGHTSGAGAPPPEELTDELFRLEFGVDVSLRYHAKRRAWYEAWHNFGMAAAVLSATAAFATVLKNSETGKWIALGLAAITAMDLIVGFNRKASIHTDLYQRFSALLEQIVSEPNPDSAQVRIWRAARTRIEADEPPQKSTLNVICHNEAAVVRRVGPEDQYHVSWLEHRLSPMFSFRTQFKTLQDRQEAPARLWFWRRSI